MEKEQAYVKIGNQSKVNCWHKGPKARSRLGERDKNKMAILF
jgi:hypothetical protein